MYRLMASQSSAQRGILGPPATVSGSAVRCGSLPHQHSRPQKNFCSHISARCDGGTGGRAAGRDSISTLTSLRDVTLITKKVISHIWKFLLSHLCEMWRRNHQKRSTTRPISTLTSLRDVTRLHLMSWPADMISTLTSLRDVTGVIKMLRKCFAISTLTSLRDVTVTPNFWSANDIISTLTSLRDVT